MKLLKVTTIYIYIIYIHLSIYINYFQQILQVCYFEKNPLTNKRNMKLKHKYWCRWCFSDSQSWHTRVHKCTKKKRKPQSIKTQTKKKKNHRARRYRNHLLPWWQKRRKISGMEWSNTREWCTNAHALTTVPFSARTTLSTWTHSCDVCLLDCVRS